MEAQFGLQLTAKGYTIGNILIIVNDGIFRGPIIICGLEICHAPRRTNLQGKIRARPNTGLQHQESVQILRILSVKKGSDIIIPVFGGVGWLRPRKPNVGGIIPC